MDVRCALQQMQYITLGCHMTYILIVANVAGMITAEFFPQNYNQL